MTLPPNQKSYPIQPSPSSASAAAKQILHRNILLTGVACALVTGASAAITIPTVFVGDAGNAPDSTGYGGVNYGYHIGTYEVTNSQYAAFLNAKAAMDVHELYNPFMSSGRRGGIQQSGISGNFTYSVKSGFGNKPVNYVSFWDAARFTNWLTNGQGSGDTETGMYTLTPAGIADKTIERNATAWAAGGVAVTSENEWYKAAYYSGSATGADGDGYWLYPTQSNSITTADANYDWSVETDEIITDVGAYSGAASYYGTFDQGGNIDEWNDTIVISSVFDTTYTERVMRGGMFGDWDQTLQSSSRNGRNPTFNPHYVGFRVSSLAPITAAIPEPSTALLIGLTGALALLRRRR